MRLVRTNHFLLHSSTFIRVLHVFTAISTAFLLQAVLPLLSCFSICLSSRLIAARMSIQPSAENVYQVDRRGQARSFFGSRNWLGVRFRNSHLCQRTTVHDGFAGIIKSLQLDCVFASFVQLDHSLTTMPCQRASLGFRGSRMGVTNVFNLLLPHPEHRFYVSQPVVRKEQKGSSFAAEGALSDVDQRT